MEKNINLKTKVQIMDKEAIQRALMRLSYEIIEKKIDPANLVIVGIKTRGIPLAEILQKNIIKNTGVEPLLGSVDIQFYRDDLNKISDIPQVQKVSLPFDINNKEIVLVDDVLFTGRTVRAAIDALFDNGRPARVSLAILVDRGHRELPIRPDFVGKNVPTSLDEVIRVRIEPIDEKTNVEICERI